MAGAACLYRKEGKQEAGNAFLAVIVAAQPAAQDVEVWPENWQAFQLFARLSSQWRSGMGGPTGLCYEALYPLLDRAAASPEEWDELFDDIRAMEREALSVMQEPT